jgi:hypothetical protein
MFEHNRNSFRRQMGEAVAVTVAQAARRTMTMLKAKMASRRSAVP